MARPGSAAHGGFTYLGLLFVVAAMGASLALVGVVWHTVQKREKERELLFVGNQYRQAIGQYFSRTPGTTRHYPRRLQDLLQDPRHLTTQRYLRKLYPDPITGRMDWELVKAADGGIMGVYSPSEDEPLKGANFSAADQDFEGKKSYAEWWFVSTPKQAAGQPAAGNPAAPPGTPVLPGVPAPDASPQPQ
jgi:type II secretory pathway pseudopilin PulG